MVYFFLKHFMGVSTRLSVNLCYRPFCECKYVLHYNSCNIGKLLCYGFYYKT